MNRAPADVLKSMSQYKASPVTLPNMATPATTGSAGYYGQSVYPNNQMQATYPQSWYSGQGNDFSDWSYLNQLNGIF